MKDGEVKARVEQLIGEWLGESDLTGSEEEAFKAKETARAISAWQFGHEQAAQAMESRGRAEERDDGGRSRGGAQGGGRWRRVAGERAESKA